MIRFVSLGLWLVLIWGSCTPLGQPEDPLVGTYIGAAFEMDLDRHHPWPKALHLDAGGTFRHQAIDLPGTPDWTGKWEKTNWSLRLDTIALIHEQQYDLEDTLLWIRKGLFTRYYFRPKEVQLAENVESLLTGKWWESDDLWLYLAADQRILKVHKSDTLTKTFQWGLDSIGPALCLIERGLPSRNADSFCGFTAQVLKVDEHHLQLYHWQGNSMKITHFRSARDPEIPIAAGPAFQTCNPFLYINNPSDRYYYKGTDLPGGNYQVWKMLRQHLRLLPGNTESGLVRIRFVVNCQGETGQFEVLELDENYQEKKFDSDLPEQLLWICRMLDGWLPGKDDEGRKIDTYYFITFRIRNGEVVDIFP